MLRHKQQQHLVEAGRKQLHEVQARSEREERRSSRYGRDNVDNSNVDDRRRIRRARQYRNHDDDRNDDDRNDDDDEEAEESRWRQAAQMLSDEEIEIFSSPQTEAPNQRQQESNNNKQTKTTTARGKQLFSPGAGAAAASSTRATTPDSSAAQAEELAEYLEDDDNSSISFAQSGCHSILSAWRIKAANKVRLQQLKQQQQPTRPTSVLSNASSAKKSIASTAFTLRSSGRAPASQSRIPLGPRQAQHFVTNTRRRRRANELILTTLEARRRALALNRQNATSLFGSGSYLNEADLNDLNLMALQGGEQAALLNRDGPNDFHHQYHQQQSSRLSLSPTPRNDYNRTGRTPSPLVLKQQQQRGALSDLGGSIQQQQLLEKRLRQRRPPPLAKLDQNSSDLNTSNSSSSSSESLSSSSSGSQFTQMVTNELAPDCILLDEQALRPRVLSAISRANSNNVDKNPSSRMQQLLPVAQSRNVLSTKSEQPNVSNTKPKPAERHKRQRQLLLQQQHQQQQQQQQQQQFERQNRIEQTRKALSSPSSNDDDDDVVDGDKKQKSLQSKSGPSKGLRRGALRRDSIRRLRLNRKQQEEQEERETKQKERRPRKRFDSSSSDIGTAARSTLSDSLPTLSSQTNEHINLKTQALPTARKLDIENNPFLNRGHFRRSTSAAPASRGGGSSIGIGGNQTGAGTVAFQQLVSENVDKQRLRHKQLQQQQRNSLLLASKSGKQTNSTSPLENNKFFIRGSQEEDLREASRVFRSNSSEHLHRDNNNKNSFAINNNNNINERNKLVKQQEHERARVENNNNDQVRHFERMLRQMKPNETFASHSNSRESFFSQQQEREQDVIKKSFPTTTTTRNNNNDDDDIRLSSSAKTSQLFKGGIKSSSYNNNKPHSSATFESRSTNKEEEDDDDYESSYNNNNNNKSNLKPEAIIREGSKSRSDLKFDLLGNKKKIDSEKRWRYEFSSSENNNPQVSANRQTSSSSSSNRISERMIKSEMEIIRSTSISPPLAFSERAAVGRSSGLVGTSGGGPPERPPKPPRTSPSGFVAGEPRTRRPIEAPQRKSLQQQQQQQQQQKSFQEINSSTATSSPSRLYQSNSYNSYYNAQNKPSNGAVSQPNHLQTTTMLDSGSRNYRSVSAERRPPVAERKRAPIVAERQQQQQLATSSDLPTFERTADDEFRKRVDYLRRLAKANLVEQQAQLNESSESSKQKQLAGGNSVKTTKPMTTNWKQQEPMEASEFITKSSTTYQAKASKLGAPAISPKPRSSQFHQVQTTGPSTLSTTLSQANNAGLFADERANWKLGHLAERPLTEARRSPATTNLDSILTDHRYQLKQESQPHNNNSNKNNNDASSPFKWHRSNSSLASLHGGSGCDGGGGGTRNQSSNSVLIAKDDNVRSSNSVLTTKTKTNTTTLSKQTRPLSPLLLSTTTIYKRNPYEQEQQEQQLLQRSLMSTRNINKNNNNSNSNSNIIRKDYFELDSGASKLQARESENRGEIDAYHQSGGAGLMKLVVKEKTGPRLNFAFVERPASVKHVVENVTQQETTANTKPIMAVGKLIPKTTPLSTTTTTSSTLANSATGSGSGGGKKPQQTMGSNRTRSPLRVASPRSPEYGGMATSSNDDSAIASSVSSPSLSFMLNNNNNQQQSGSELTKLTSSGGGAYLQTNNQNNSTQGQQRAQAPRGQATPVVGAKLLAGDGPISGNLQSILRRVHQQQHSGESSDSSQATPGAGDNNPTTTTTTKTTTTTSQFTKTSIVSEERSKSQQLENFPSNFNNQQQENQTQSSKAQPPLTISKVATGVTPAASHQQAQFQQQQEATNNETGTGCSRAPVEAFASNSSSPPKRVHFNDRTSIRSFESISSLNSNSTAVPNEPMAMLRQQVGSPDSMESGSGHSSRLSAESPDLRKISSSGAAIYAIRGDPELEFQHDPAASLVNAIGLHTAAQLTRNPYGAMHQQHQQHSQAQAQGGPDMMQRRIVLQQQQQQQFNPSLGYIRMTAPPAISTTSNLAVSSPVNHQQIIRQQQQQQSRQDSSLHGYIVRPTSLTSTHIMPATSASQQQQQLEQQPLDEDEDPSYALRLRQAATSRVFRYAPQQQVLAHPLVGGQMLSPKQQQAPLLPNQMVIQQQQGQYSLQSNQQQQQQQHREAANSRGLQRASQGPPPLKRPSEMEEYVNFQTEV